MCPSARGRYPDAQQVLFAPSPLSNAVEGLASDEETSAPAFEWGYLMLLMLHRGLGPCDLPF